VPIQTTWNIVALADIDYLARFFAENVNAREIKLLTRTNSRNRSNRFEIISQLLALVEPGVGCHPFSKARTISATVHANLLLGSKPAAFEQRISVLAAALLSWHRKSDGPSCSG
jgi:hypothetical protein